MVTVDEIITYESTGFDTEEELFDFFQRLIDSGMAWTLQGSYGRMAISLIEDGHCNLGGH